MCIIHRFHFTCGHTSRITEAQKCKHMEMMDDWLSDDTPTPKVFCDLLTTQCEEESRDKYEERERICGACMITAREKQEREEKMQGKEVHWADGVEIQEFLSRGKGKSVARFLKNENEEVARDCGEGSSGSKASKTGKKWFLKNGYLEDEDGDYEEGEYSDEEDLFVYEEEKYGEGPGNGQEKGTGIGRFLKIQNEDDDGDLFFYEKYGESSTDDNAKETGIGKFLKSEDAEDESGDDEDQEDVYEEPYLDELL